MATVEHNADGSAVIILEKPVTFTAGKEEDETNRLTVPALRGKHLRMLPVELGESKVQWADIANFAARITLPAGAFDELEWNDSKFVTEVVIGMVGKAQGGGAPASSP